MKSLRNLTLAATLALIGMAGGYAGDARAASDYVKPGESRGIIAIKQGELVPAVKPGELLPAVMPTDQREGFVQQAYGDALGRKAGDGAADLVVGAGGGKPGEANGLIGLLKPADQAGITDGSLPAVQMPTDQKNGDGRADLVTGAGAAGAQGKAWTGNVVLDSSPPVGSTGLNKVGTGTLTLGGSTHGYGSLHGLGSTRDLFANSRGGDQSAGAHGAGGGGGAGKVVFQDIHMSAKAGDGSVMPTDQLTGKGEGKPVALLLPAVQAAREAARSSGGTSGGAGGGAAGGSQVAGNAIKGVNIQGATRK